MDSANDPGGFRLGADVSVPAGVADPVGVAASGDDVSAASATAPVQQVVLAATTSPSGSAGDYSATPLSESGSWTAGGSTGAFNYSYPVQVPAVPGGLEPQVSLGYSSQAVDGLTSSTNDLESFGFAGPAFAFRFGDAGQEVVADFFEAVPLGGVGAEHGAADAPLTELVAMFPQFRTCFCCRALACPRE